MGTFLCFLVVFTAFPKILIIGKKVLMRTSPFLTVVLHFWENRHHLGFTECEAQERHWRPAAQPAQTHSAGTSASPLLQQQVCEGTPKPGVTLQKKTCENVPSFYSAQKMGSLFFNSAILLPFLHLNFMIPQSRNKMQPSGSVLSQHKIVPHGN